MVKNLIKLAIVVGAFVLGLAGNAFWYFEQKENKNDEQLIRIVVKGQVIDTSGRPVKGAKVLASLGLDLEGETVESDSSGQFVAQADSQIWFKICRPSVKARADGYAEEWIFFDCRGWDKGERQFQQIIVLKPKIENTENKN